MEIRTRAFPHPVLAPNSDDFSSGEVRIRNARGETAPERYSIEFDFDVSHPTLCALVESGEALAAVVVECRHNLFRRRFPVVLGANRLEIFADELRGIVQVTPVISAGREIGNYQPSLLNADYRGIEIRVPRHGILAFGLNFEFIADPRADRLRKISSIMRVVQVEDAKRNLTVNIDGPRIRVEVSRQQFVLYQGVAESRRGSSVLASMLVLPVLVDVFHRIKNGGPDEFQDYRWFQVVRARLLEMGKPVDSGDFDPMREAQALLDAPFARGIDELFMRLDPERDV